RRKRGSTPRTASASLESPLASLDEFGLHSNQLAEMGQWARNFASARSDSPGFAESGDLVGDLKAFAIGSAEDFVGLGVVGHLGLGIEGQGFSEDAFDVVEDDLVVLEMLFHAGESFIGVLVIAQGLGARVERDFFAQAIGS